MKLQIVSSDLIDIVKMQMMQLSSFNMQCLNVVH